MIKQLAILKEGCPVPFSLAVWLLSGALLIVSSSAGFASCCSTDNYDDPTSYDERNGS